MGIFFSTLGVNAQNYAVWSKPTEGLKFEKIKSANRASFPENYELMQLDLTIMQKDLKDAPNRFLSSSSETIITLPNVDGKLERYRVFEASNFDARLQAQFPEIKSFIGTGIDDASAVLRMSSDPNGIQAMIFRTDKRNEFIEKYSNDGLIYAVFNSSRQKGKLPFTCSTPEQTVSQDLLSKVTSDNLMQKSSTAELLTFKLALSCNGEYANYFGATSSAQVANVLAAFNATMTRVNGVFERDFGIHMNIVAETTNVIYYNPSTDPYTTLSSWNVQLQNTLSNNLTGLFTSLAANNAAYDIGHMFGASGGGGNAGCIGCVCVNDTSSTSDKNKGSGITSPADGVPQGDNFDIDYVAHEMGHQFGANHTFSMSNENSGVNVEVGSGSTIMGYAGITAQDVQPNSDDYFHYASIFQVQNNMEDKTCPVRTTMTNNTPVAEAGNNYTIPKSTPFILTGSGSDVDGDALTYCWEQIDNASASQTGSASAASITKASGPNWRSYPPTTSSSRYMPPLNRVVANQSTTQGSEITVEALSLVARTLTFALTVRDNAALEGQTHTDGMVVTVNGTAGPFLVSAPNTAVNWQAGSNQTVTWDVAGTTTNGVNANFVDIFLSNDGGFTYPIQLASKVPNDGSETITVPNTVGTQNRIMVKGWNHIFYDISNTNFTISAPAATFSVAFSGVEGGQNKEACQGSLVSFDIPYLALGGFAGTTSFTLTGGPAGATAVFTPSTISSDGNVVLEISNTGSSAVQFYAMTVTATSGTTSKSVPLYLNLIDANFGTQSLIAPVDLAVGQSTSPVLSWVLSPAATMYDVEVATDVAFSNIVATATSASNSFGITGLNEATDYYWRVTPKNDLCSGASSAIFKFTTGQSNCTYTFSNNTALSVPDGVGQNAPGAEATKTIVVPTSVSGSINDLTIDLSFAHSYIEDLVIWVTHPDGTSIQLWDRNCDNEFSAVSFNFADGNPTIPGTGCTQSSGTFSPITPISAVFGKPAAGTWVLHAQDYWNGDTGTINNWALNFCVAEPALSSESFDLTGVSLYPNPNKGSFNVKFDALSDEVQINVHDIRGRQILSRNYKAVAVFNEAITLSTAEAGIYLVTIINGDRKVTKKIVVE